MVDDFASEDLRLDRDKFLRRMVRHLAGSLEDVVGLEEAEGYISLVGERMGDEILAEYKAALGAEGLSPARAAEVMVDLKRRIEGDFHVIEADDERIVLGNRACPFGDQVHGRESMCMMTSNVFGRIGAETSGYAKVSLAETIARGDPGCRIVVHLRTGPEAQADEGREYFADLPEPEAGA